MLGQVLNKVKISVLEQVSLTQPKEFLPLSKSFEIPLCPNTTGSRAQDNVGVKAGSAPPCVCPFK